GNVGRNIARITDKNVGIGQSVGLQSELCRGGVIPCTGRAAGRRSAVGIIIDDTRVNPVRQDRVAHRLRAAIRGQRASEYETTLRAGRWRDRRRPGQGRKSVGLPVGPGLTTILWRLNSNLMSQIVIEDEC